MFAIRHAQERGHANYGWLETHHSFSFADYYDPAHLGFETLRVINEDFVAPGTGFDTHGHRDMEIITYVISGTVEHRDSMGNHALIRSGEVQRMTAGTGIYHSERNPSPTEPLHLLQIWIRPDRNGYTPSYEQKLFGDDAKRDRLTLIAAPDGRDGALHLHQSVNLYATRLSVGAAVEHTLAGRPAWVQAVDGTIRVNGTPLSAGDGAAISGEQALTLEAHGGGEALVFDFLQAK